MAPTVGRIVHYQLSDADCMSIRQLPGAHNPVHEGQVLPAVVVAVFTVGDTSPAPANLQVLLDGDGSYWATSRLEGDAPGTWAWPPRT